MEVSTEEVAEAMRVKVEVGLGLTAIQNTITKVNGRVSSEAAALIVFTLEMHMNLVSESVAVELGEDLTRKMKELAADFFKKALINGGKTC